jgi:hypothetical protein
MMSIEAKTMTGLMSHRKFFGGNKALDSIIGSIMDSAPVNTMGLLLKQLHFSMSRGRGHSAEHCALQPRPKTLSFLN